MAGPTVLASRAMRSNGISSEQGNLGAYVHYEQIEPMQDFSLSDVIMFKAVVKMVGLRGK